MIKHFLLFAGFFLSMQVIAQTGIGTPTPDASARLEVAATNKGFLPPRVTLSSVTDATTIPTPATGLLVYNLGSVGLKAGYYYWNGSNWATIATASSPDQTVDYVSVTLTGNQTVESGSVVLFNSNIGGNIPYNASTGMFSLTAGKTYRLTGVIAIASNNASQEEVNVGWKTAAGDFIGGRGEALSSNFSSTAFGSGIADVFYTPTTNTTISLTVNYGSGTVILWQNFTYANIQQIGSSATINPWVLSETTTYNTTGNVGIGNSSPNASSILDITSTTQGITFPRMTSTQRNAISSPTNGLQVFDITTNSIWYFDGSSWVNSVSVASFGDVKTGFQSTDHDGWIRLNGRAKSTLSATQQTQATALGANLPNASNAFLVQNGQALGSVTGSNTITIARNQLPNVSFEGSIINVAHGAFVQASASGLITRANGNSSGNAGGGGVTNNFNLSIPLNGGVNQQDVNITPRSLSVNTFIYLGN